MKKKLLLLVSLIIIGVNSYAGQKDELKFINELYKQKNFSMALSESKIFMDKYPNSKYIKSLQDRVAKVYFLQDDYNNSINYFKILLLNDKLKDSEKDEVYYYLAKNYAKLNDKKTSEEYLNLIDGRSKYLERAIYENGITYMANKKYDYAKEYFLKTAQIAGENYNNSILNLALLSYNQQQYNNTLIYLKEYSTLKGDKNYTFMSYLLGASYYKLGKINEAIDSFEQGLQLEKKDGYTDKSILNLIEIYSNEKMYGKAVEKLKIFEIEEKWSLYNEGIRIIGDSYASLENYSKAVEYYSKAKDYNSPKLLYSYSFSLYKLNKLEEARPYFESLKSTSYYGDSLFYLFSIDYKLGNYKKIVDNRAIVNSVAISKEDRVNIYLIIANSSYEVKNYKLSKEYYEKVYKLAPEMDTLYRLMVLNGKLGNRKELEKNYQEYQTKYQDDVKYRENIVLIMGENYYKNKQYDEAEKLYKFYLQMGNSSEIKDNLIVILLTKQKYTEVLGYLETMEPTVKNQYTKGICQIGTGNYDEAEKIFDTILSNSGISDEMRKKTEFNQIRAYFLQKKYEKVIVAGEEYTAQYNDKNEVEVIDKVAISYYRLGNMEKSKEYFTMLENFSEYKEYAKYQLADLYYGQKDYSKALAKYQEILVEYPKGKYSEEANYWQLRTLLNLEKIDEFEMKKEEFIRKYPNSQFKENIYIVSNDYYLKKGNKEKILENDLKLYESTKNKKLKDEIGIRIIELKLKENKLQDSIKYIENLSNQEDKSYYMLIVYRDKNLQDERINECEKLLNSEKYKDYAGVTLGDYYYNNKNYESAKSSYQIVDNLETTQYKDYVLLRLAMIDEKEENYSEALRKYTKGYVLYNGNYSQISKLKSGQMNEKLGNEEEAFKIYKELYSLGKNYKYREFILEKMLYFTLKSGNKIEAKKYFDELEMTNKVVADKYKKYFSIEEEK